MIQQIQYFPIGFINKKLWLQSSDFYLILKNLRQRLNLKIQIP